MKASNKLRVAYTILVVVVLSLCDLAITWATNTESEATHLASSATTSGVQPPTMPIATATRSPLINITRAQYDEAHNLWLSKRISTYQISLRQVSMRIC